MAIYLADTSVLARLHHDDVAARVQPLFLGGQIATCGAVDLEVLSAVSDRAEHEEMRGDRHLLPSAAMTDAVYGRAAEVRGLSLACGSVPELTSRVLLIAAAAELAGMTVLHYDRGFDEAAAITGQPVEWVVAAGTVP